MLITKGDLFHQEAKVARSGLADLFHRIEIVSEKDAATYARVLARVRAVARAVRHGRQFPALGHRAGGGLGGWGVYMPYHATWAHEQETSFDEASTRLARVAAAGEIPAALLQLGERAASEGARGISG